MLREDPRGKQIGFKTRSDYLEVYIPTTYQTIEEAYSDIQRVRRFCRDREIHTESEGYGYHVAYLELEPTKGCLKEARYAKYGLGGGDFGLGFDTLLQMEKDHRDTPVVKPQTWKDWCKANRSNLFAGALAGATATIAAGVALAQYAEGVKNGR